MSPRLRPDPFLEELAISQLPRIGDLGGRLSLASIEAQKGRYGSDHVSQGEVVSARGCRHEIRGVKLHLGEANTALGLSDTGLDEVAQQWPDSTACRAPGGGPEGEEWRAG